jgi:hypothetical protein
MLLALTLAMAGPVAPVQSAPPELAGGATALPVTTVGPSVLANGGFESGSAAPWSGGPGWTIDRQTTHAGRFSYRRDAGAPTATTTLALTAGTYRLSAWIKTADLAGNVRLRLDLRPSSFQWSTNEVERGTADWRRYETELVIAERATVTLGLEAEDGATGTAWFDDLALEEVLPPALQAFALYPNFRGMVFDDGPSTLTFDVQVVPPGRDFGRHTVRGVLRDEATGTVLMTAVYPARAAIVAQLDASSMRLDRTYLATFTLIDDRSGTEVYATPPYRVVRASASARAAMNASFDRENRLEVRGVPRFLLGGDDPRIARRARMSRHVEMLDACATTADAALARYASARGRPDALVVAAVTPSDDPRRWRAVADLVATDAHALFGPEPAAGYDHGAVARATARLRAAVKDARPVLGILPFAPLSSLGRRPTYAEMRAHAYMAIVEGARGLWWASPAPGACGDCRGDSQEINNLTSVIEELTALEPVLLADDAHGALSANSNSNIKTRVKRVNGTGFVLAYNASGSRQSTTFTWSTVPGTVRVHAEDRALVPSGRAFSDVFGPFAAHVYVVADDAGAR